MDGVSPMNKSDHSNSDQDSFNSIEKDKAVAPKSVSIYDKRRKSSLRVTAPKNALALIMQGKKRRQSKNKTEIIQDFGRKSQTLQEPLSQPREASSPTRKSVGPSLQELKKLVFNVEQIKENNQEDDLHTPIHVQTSQQLEDFTDKGKGSFPKFESSLLQNIQNQILNMQATSNSAEKEQQEDQRSEIRHPEILIEEKSPSEQRHDGGAEK